jgi:hypothetical protein
MHNWENVVGGAVAGTSAVLFTYPLDVIRVRLAVEIEKSQSKGIVAKMKGIHAAEGTIGLFRGIGPTLVVSGEEERGKKK